MSKMTRRRFVGTAATAAGALLSLQGAASGQNSTIGTGVSADALSVLGWDSFLPFVGTEFSFVDGNAAVPLTLLNMKDSRPLRAASRRLRQENFVLKFAGPGYNRLGDGTYNVDHFNLGRFQLFITVGETVGNETQYLAVINRVMTKR